MTAQTLEGHLGTEVQIDFCPACQMFWFDHLESLRLSPAATLGLFRMMSDQSHQSAPRPVAGPVNCPRCGLHLLLTNDRQRNTPFRYWRCAREHGRLISFFDFLREKDFIRPLSAEQLADLRKHLQMINCSNCGAPIDIVRASECGHCGTPVSMLDVKQIADAAEHSKQRAAPSKPALDLDAVFQMLKADRDRDRSQGGGLVEAGLRALGLWLSSS
jgi:hypothetical protein